ncbi:MAG TPA: hypothetical protein VG096_10685 [Bryobacteraceae bacterium]|jgi:hypothetical protein|nr:hypothetical protein [Bryobacteraceae bacterium]
MRFWHAGGIRLALFVWLVYSVCPPFTSYDSFWSVPTALSVLRHGTTNVDEFVAAAPRDARWGLECVPAGGPPLHYWETDVCPGGHWYNLYPLAVSLFALPFVLIEKLVVAVIGGLVPRTGPLFSQPAVVAFFSGDFVAGHALAELWCASTFGAVAVWLQYQTAALFLSARMAAAYALLFAFGTPEWSIGSRNLFQHGLVVLLLSVTVYVLLRAREDPSRVRYAAIPLALSFAVRPWNAISVAVLTVFVAVHYRRQFIPFVLWAAPVAVLYFAYDLLVRHSLFPLYISRTRPESLPWLQGLAMHLFSPSRGILIFTPVAMVAVVGMVLCLRFRWAFPLAPYLIAIVVLHVALLSRYWPGSAYGPRFFADIAHLLTLFLIPAFLYWQKLRGASRTISAAVFLALAAWGVFTNGRGATSVAAQEWNLIPAKQGNVLERVWDWRDPQFLHGLL